MSQEKNPPRQLAWVGVALLSAIPFIGIIPGALALRHGWRTWQSGGWKILLLAGVCLLTTAKPVVEYAAYRLGGGLEADSQAVVRRNLEWLVIQIEKFRESTGSYPTSLSALGDSEEIELRSFDPTLVHGVSSTRGQRLYFERVNDNHYMLFSNGPDGTPFTGDDIRPDADPRTAPGYTYDASKHVER